VFVVTKYFGVWVLTVLVVVHYLFLKNYELIEGASYQVRTQNFSFGGGGGGDHVAIYN
jgi:hypothetical protein